MKRNRGWADIPGVAYPELRVEFTSTGFKANEPEEGKVGMDRRTITKILVDGKEVSKEMAMGLGLLVTQSVNKATLLWDKGVKKDV